MAIGDDARRSGAEARAGARGDRTSIEPDITPALPDRLVAARERKGVDLFRAERDTKIRARYLAALERGDYRSCPGPSTPASSELRCYLRLDPVTPWRQWRLERGDQVPTEPVVAPKAILETPRPLTFSPSIVVAALMTVGVIVFGIYLATQLMRFAKPPSLELVSPASAVVEAPRRPRRTGSRGTSTPGATIMISPGANQPVAYRVTALSDGTWTVSVDVRRGPNQFYIDALDPDTGKHAEEPKQLIINVPYLVIQAPTLTVTQPQDGTTFENGAIPVEGMTTNASKVVVRATWLGPPDGSAPPTAAPTATPIPDPSASAPPDEPDGVTVEVAADGSFATPLELIEGRWSITITATSPEGKTASLTRTVTVAYKGVNLVVTIQGGNAWLKVWSTASSTRA
jgi:hypothetical protein